MIGQCFLVFGVSGVGKTTACADYVRRHLGFAHLNAGLLIGASRNLTNSNSRTSDPQQILDNQAIIVQQLAEFRRVNPDQSILLDSHAIINSDRDLIRVPLGTIRSTSPDGLLLLEAPASTIFARRQARAPGRTEGSVSAIERESMAERGAVLHYAESLRLPLEWRTVGEDFRLDDAIEALRRRLQNKDTWLA